MLKINTSLPGFDRQVELARRRLDSRTIIRLQNELAAARRERDIAVSEATVHRLERDLERHISATYLAERDTLKAERDSVKDALERYNPEVINRQEELRNIDAQLQRETDVEKLHRPALSCPLRGDPLTRMRQGLTYLGRLHRKLVAQCRRREGQKAHRRREKRGIWTGPPLPTPVIPRPVSVAIVPLPPPSCGFGMKRGREEYEDEDEYEDDEDDQQPWKVQKVEYEEEDKEWPLAEERCEREGQDYQQDGDYEEEEHYEDEENGSSLKFEEYAYYY